MSNGGYCNVTQNLHTHRQPKHTQKKVTLPKSNVRLLPRPYTNKRLQWYDSTPKPSGHYQGIYIPLWMAYALQQGRCDAVPLLCDVQAVQGASPYNVQPEVAWVMQV